MQKQSNNRYSSDAMDDLGMDFISIECLEKLGLDQNPFIDHARDPFLFSDQQLEMSMNVLMDYLINQNSTIVLLGEIGIGKTTHLRMLLRRGYQQFNFCTLRAKPKITFIEIEQKIKERWHLPQNKNDNEENSDLLDLADSESLATSEHIKKYIESDKLPVLIIDDAHRLQNDVLNELLKLKHHVGLQSHHTMGLVLASEPALQSQLAELEQVNPAATQIYQINVRPFDTHQCKEYIQYRLDKAGSSNESLLIPEIISEIHAKSKGLPKYINKLAREEISKICDENSSNTSHTNSLKSNPAMRLGVILSGLICLAVIFFALSNNSNKGDESVPLDLAKPKIEENLKTEDSIPKISTSGDTEKSNKKITKDKSVKLTSTPSEKPILKPYVAPLVLGPLLDKKTEREKNKPALEPVQKPKAPGKNSNTQEVVQNSPYSSNWIMKQDPSAYTIQVVASQNEKNLIDFAKKNSLLSNTAYYKKPSTDKSLYVLVHGVYKTREEAITSIQGLSEVLKKNTPYPVQIKYLQEVIVQQ
ncbi:MAG: AAA family ATPase [Gammaproteobacteria bacterium]